MMNRKIFELNVYKLVFLILLLLNEACTIGSENDSPSPKYNGETAYIGRMDDFFSSGLSNGIFYAVYSEETVTQSNELGIVPIVEYNTDYFDSIYSDFPNNLDLAENICIRNFGCIYAHSPSLTKENQDICNLKGYDQNVPWYYNEVAGSYNSEPILFYSDISYGGFFAYCQEELGENCDSPLIHKPRKSLNADIFVLPVHMDTYDAYYSQYVLQRFAVYGCIEGLQHAVGYIPELPPDEQQHEAFLLNDATPAPEGVYTYFRGVTDQSDIGDIFYFDLSIGQSFRLTRTPNIDERYPFKIDDEHLGYFIDGQIIITSFEAPSSPVQTADVSIDISQGVAIESDGNGVAFVLTPLMDQVYRYLLDANSWESVFNAGEGNEIKQIILSRNSNKVLIIESKNSGECLVWEIKDRQSPSIVIGQINGSIDRCIYEGRYAWDEVRNRLLTQNKIFHFKEGALADEEK